MAIKVVFPTGTASISVGGLFQWDYGQVLEIESADIGSEIVEVHFACPSMTEAIVRPCSFSNGVGTVTIPDQCLEQTNTVTAWIFKIEGTQGHTIKTITLPVTGRTRPSKTRDVPAENIDKYAELITEINQAVEALESGNVKAAKAAQADNAARADTAGNAENANYAVSAGQAARAATAESVIAVPTNLAVSCSVEEGSGEVLSEAMPFSELVVVVFEADGERHIGVYFDYGLGDYYTRIGEYVMEVMPGTNVSSIYLTREGVDDANINGTLKFYRLGGGS